MSDFSASVRRKNLERLSRDKFDILVVGGGITGAGIARDAALRGLRVALVDKGDFASGTSSRSSKLVHGGLRYLESFQPHMVYECSRERYKLKKIAPHLIKPLPYIMPLYKGEKIGPGLMNLGMWLYKILGSFSHVKRHKMLKPEQLLRLEPAIREDGLLGGVFFYESMVDDARLTLMTIIDAHRHGATVANYAGVVAFIKEAGRVVEAEVEDQLSGSRFLCRARMVINAAGPWVDRILTMDQAEGERLRLSKGINLLVPRERLGHRCAVAMRALKDRRSIFVLPHGPCSIIGTTDTDYDGSLERVYAIKDDVDYLLESTNRYFPQAHLGYSDILSTWAALRPLVGAGGGWVYRASREHKIFQSDSGLMTIAGGKMTTYRLMAKGLVDKVTRMLTLEHGIRPQRGCATDQEPLPGGEAEPARYLAFTRKLESQGLSKATAAHLVCAYGTAYPRILGTISIQPQLQEPIVPGLPYTFAEIPYAIGEEMAVTLSDFMSRRTRILYEVPGHGLEEAKRVAQVMAEYLGWDAHEQCRQVELYSAEALLSERWKKE